MGTNYLLFESTNVKDDGGWEESVFTRTFKTFSNFNEAEKAMRERILSFAETDGVLFDGNGNIKGFDELCDILHEYESVYHPGTWERYDVEKNSEIISKSSGSAAARPSLRKQHPSAGSWHRCRYNYGLL
mgnify:CR=1 FL=1